MGAGVPLTATVAISANVPGEPAVLLARTALGLAAFDTGSVTAAFDPGMQKTWQITAAVEEATLPDPNQANNTRSWVFSRRVPESLYLPTLKQAP